MTTSKKQWYEKEILKFKKEIEYLENELKQWNKLKTDFEKDYKNPNLKEYKGSISVDIAQCKMNIDLKKTQIKRQTENAMILKREMNNIK